MIQSLFFYKLVLVKKCARDIYRKRNDPGFSMNRDIDLEDLRSLMGDHSEEERKTRFGHYLQNIAKILLQSRKFVGYPETVKDDIRSLGILDAYSGASNFDGDKFRAQTAPFSYIYRIMYNRATHVIKDFYRDRAFTVTSDSGSSIANTLSADEEEDSRPTVTFRRLGFRPQHPAIYRAKLKFSAKVTLKREIQLSLPLF